MTLRCVFRVAAGPRLGFGHLMRARALARALGVRPMVSIRGGAAAARTARSLGCTILGDRSDALDRADVIVVDDPSPAHRRLWLRRAARRHVASVAIVDRGVTQAQAGLVVNGSVTAESGAGARGTRADAGKTRVLAGVRFYILDRRIAGARHGAALRRRQGRRRRVLVALGGGSHVLSAAARLVRAVRERCPEAAIDVASGFVANRRGRLEGGRWLEGRRGLASALSSADAAVVAGGVTLYEACAIGVPAVGLAVVAAQRPAIRRLAATGALLDAGGPLLDKGTLARVAEGVRGLLADGQGRRMSRRARELVDGRGADRVAAAIRRLVTRQEGRTRG